MSYAIALVHAWLIEHPEYYCSYVRPYTQLRWCQNPPRMLACKVGGHWRRLADWASVLPALRRTCKFEVLAQPRYLSAPLSVTKERWSEDGEIIPRRYRVYVFV